MQKLSLFSLFFLLAACSDVNLGAQRPDGGDAAAGTTAAGSGGILGTGGNGTGSGGLTGTGGRTLGAGGVSGTGGTAVGSGAVSGTGGSVSGTGGTSGTGGAGSGGLSGTPDATDGGSTCMCNPLDAMFTEVLRTSWSCYCSVADCSRTLSDYVGFADGRMVLKDRPLDSHRTNRTFRATEYADCNLVEVVVNDQDNGVGWGNSTGKTYVFDQRTGQLVGAEDLRGDTGILCPFGPGYVFGFAAGTWPDPESCHVSATVAASVCGACGADQLCVRQYDGTCKFLEQHCVQVSSATRDSILVKHEDCFMKPTGNEICGNQDDCVLSGLSAPSCAGDGPWFSDVNCYGGLTGTGGTDGGQSSTDVPTGADAEQTCTYHGKTYPNGTEWYATDGCNECVCLGGHASCSLIACADGGLRGYSCAPGITIGDTVPSSDGCNICECGYYWYRDNIAGQPGGVLVSCTMKDCSAAPVKDAGPASDGGIDGCVYNGKTYPFDVYFPSADGCDQCHCRTDGQITCTYAHIGCRGKDAGLPVGAPDAPPDGTVTPGCDVVAARTEMTARGLVLVGSPETLNDTLPSPISGPNWGLKSTACQDGGYDISSLAGQTVCLVKQPIGQACAQAPSLAWAVMSDGAVKCVYKSADSNPGIYAVDATYVCP